MRQEHPHKRIDNDKDKSKLLEAKGRSKSNNKCETDKTTRRKEGCIGGRKDSSVSR